MITMKLLHASFFLSSTCFTGVLGFAPSVHRPRYIFSSRLFSSAPSDVEDIDETVDVPYTTVSECPEENVFELATDLKEKFGTFILDSTAKEDLQEAVKELEDTVDDDTVITEEDLLGDWKLICTTATSGRRAKGIDTSKLPSFLVEDGPIKVVRDAGNKYVDVVQRIRSDSENVTTINRVDNVIEYSPPDSLQEISDTLDNKLPEFIKSLNINPLKVTKSKVVLKHEAEVKDYSNPVTIKLNLNGIILNVAGTSQYLEADGDDVLGVNIPSIGDFMTNSGSFETTYVSKSLRISRGKVRSIEQLRVFQKMERSIESDEEIETDNDVVSSEEDLNES